MEKENKICIKCGSDDFIPNGKYTRCQPCLIEQRAKRYKARKKEFDLRNSKYLKEHPEKRKQYSKKWRDNNKEKGLQAKRAWAKKNRGRVREYCANRRARLRGATPPWADREEMKYIHQLASERGLVVDHIVPLVSDLVCGLNTPDNLRCITPELNTFKGNRYWADMPEEFKCF